jgi:hypothetical protein
MNVEADKRFGPYLALSYSRFYPDITFDQALRPEAVDAAREIINLCDFLPPEDQERIEALAATFDGPALATSSNKALQARLEQNTADGLIKAPVVIAQGLSDIVVPPSATDAYVEERCWSTTRVLDIRGTRPLHDCPARYAARGAAHQVDDSALRE